MTGADAPHRCPTPCDEDCEINGWGCHEAHAMPVQRVHEPEMCEARALAGNLRHLLDAGWEVEVFKVWPAADPVTPWHCRLRRDRKHVKDVASSGPGAALAEAVEWSRKPAALPPEPEAKPACRGFRWIGQSFATCDGCGRPAWEHDGIRRLREGAKTIFGGSDDDWEVIPWKPGEAEAIMRKWGPR